MSPPATWLIGRGDIAARVGERLRASGVPLHALSRGSRPTPPGLTLHPADLDQPDSLPVVSGRVLYTAPPAPGAESDPRMQAFLQAAGPIEVLVYLSTSGVYGDCGGDWVDEQRPPAPLTARAARRLDAESQLQAWAGQQGTRLAILRVPGIYGPGRLPLERLREGRPVLDPAQAPWSNRIHAEDLASACLLAMDRGEGLFNISDGTPSRMSDYFLACARHAGLAEPPLISWEQAQAQFSPQLLSFYRESRRLDISRARQELGFEPRYPTLEAGLAAC